MREALLQHPLEAPVIQLLRHARKLAGAAPLTLEVLWQALRMAPDQAQLPAILHLDSRLQSVLRRAEAIAD